MMSMNSEQEKSPFGELKDKWYVIADAGKQADTYMQTTRAIGEYVGRVYGREMKMLVLQLSESEPTELTYPEQGNDMAKVIWSKEYDHYLKKHEHYADYKAKVFMIILGQCMKLVQNRVEGMDKYGDVEKNANVVSLHGEGCGL